MTVGLQQHGCGLIVYLKLANRVAAHCPNTTFDVAIRSCKLSAAKEDALPGQLDGQTIIVTGGGNGFGEHMSRATAAEGANTVIADCDAGGGERVVAGIRSNGDSAVAIETDVGDEDQVGELIAKVMNRFGRIDVLVNNAGVAGDVSPFPEQSLDAWNQINRVNVTGCFLCNRAVLPHMIARKSGHIVHISSGLCRQDIRKIRSLMYLSTKFAIEGLSWGLSVHTEQHGIRVNTIRPNLSVTGLFNESDRNYLSGLKVWKPTLTVGPLLHLLCESSGTGEIIDATEWHTASGSADELTYIYE